MKPLLAALALSVLTLLPVLPAQAAAPSLITVTGQGSSSAPPDMATASFTIATNAASAAAATGENNTRYARLLKALAALHIAATDIHTTGFNVSYTPPPQPGQQPAQPPQRYGYFVNRNVDVMLHDVHSAGKAIDAAVGAGVTDVGGVSFGISDQRSARTEAIRSAVLDARSQAEAMAAAAGLHLTRIKSMGQGQGYPVPPEPRMAADVLRQAPTEIQPSDVQVTATVTITYEAQ